MKKTITICASASFYQHVGQVQDELKAMGYDVLVPQMATTMRGSGDYDVAKVKTWYLNPKDYVTKKKLMDDHFDKIKQADAVLVVNDEKRGIKGYIGSNVLMEITAAYLHGKQVYILNDVLPDAHAYEEIKGIGARMLGGQIANIAETL